MHLATQAQHLCYHNAAFNSIMCLYWYILVSFVWHKPQFYPIYTLYVCVLFVYSTVPRTLFVKEWLVGAFLSGLKDNCALHCLCHLLFARFPVPNLQMLISGWIGIKLELILGILVLIYFCFISIPILIYSGFHQSS